VDGAVIKSSDQLETKKAQEPPLTVSLETAGQDWTKAVAIHQSRKHGRGRTAGNSEGAADPINAGRKSRISRHRQQPVMPSQRNAGARHAALPKFAPKR
jgi:hypothetical protein